MVVNGKEYFVDTTPYLSLLDALRDSLALTGTKRGCDYGGCGACTVIVDDHVVYSCMTPVWRTVGRGIRTIEGISDGERLHPVQKAFIDNFGFECGYCTPGLIMSTVSLLGRNRNPSDADIKNAIAGHICRCTGYTKIIDAVKAAAAAQSARR
jgi:aerobic-type carbon monoxide dehydrogenase small subunit (CoxS/CutS family)